MQPKLPPPRGPLPGSSYQPPSAPPVPVQGSGPLNSGRASGQLPAGGVGLQASNQYLRTPMVRYSSIMRVGKQHSMRISLTGANENSEPIKPQSLSGGFDPPILVQVTIPGALVTPTHQIIPLSGGDANFDVQPISSGKLKGAKVEFLSQGRKISEIPLPIKANRGSLAKWLLAFGLLLPFIINLLPDFSYQQQLIDGTPSGPVVFAPMGGVKVPDRGAPRTPQKATPRNSKDTTPSKNSNNNSNEKQPEKSTEQTPGKPAASLMNFQETSLLLLVALQAPGDEKQKSAENTEKKTPQKKGGQVAPKTESPESSKSLGSTAKTDENSVENSNPQDESKTTVQASKPAQPLITYRGEDAIWAWTRHKLQQNGFKTKTVSVKDREDQLTRLFVVDRTYEIVEYPSSESNTRMYGALGLYYLEPVFRWLYRIFIQFPKDIPFADLGFGLFFIALGVIAWVLTGPNRKKIKGAVMDIRLAS